MPRPGKCPVCGFKAPGVTFYSEAEEGTFTIALLALHPAIQVYAVKYLSLFRPKSGCAIQPPKVERLTTELNQLSSSGHVQVKGKSDRPCPPSLWALAIERMIEQAGFLNLPLKTHGYLKTVAWDIADKADAKNEAGIRQNEITGQRRDPRVDDDEMSPIMRTFIEKNGDPLKRIPSED